MLEFALAIPIVLFLLLGAVEIARFGLLKLMLTRATVETLNLVQKLPEIDADTRDCPSASPCDPLARLVRARATAMQQALRIPSLLISNDPTSNAYFENYQETTSVAGGDTPTPPESGQVLILRPGEVGTNLSTGETITHPTMCASYDGACPFGRDKLTSSNPWRDVLRNNSIVVRMSAKIRPLLPLLPMFSGGFTIQAEASAPRETPALIRLTPYRPAAVTVVPPPTPAPLTCPDPTQVICADDCFYTTCAICESFDFGVCSCGPTPGMEMCGTMCVPTGTYEMCGTGCVPVCATGKTRAADGSCTCCGPTDECLMVLCINPLYPFSPFPPTMVMPTTIGCIGGMYEAACVAYNVECS